MTTGSEASLVKKAFDWGRRALSLGKRIATLESRVTALEEKLEKRQPDGCPFCGEHAMRLTEQSNLMGDPGKQWTWEIWTCEKCSQKDKRFKKL